MNQAIAALGVGFGFRELYRSDVFFHRPKIDFLEFTVDHYMNATGAKLAELELLANNFTLIPHGLNLSLGSAEGLDRDYLKQFAAVVRKVNPPYWSEHIAFTRANQVDIGHLAPLPFTREAISVLRRNISEARRTIDLPLILENITYTMPMPGGEISEADFLSEVLEQSDCGLLLDVTNLHTNSINHGYDAAAFLDRIPLERVVQLHFAGGFWEEGVLIDSHSRATPPEVWELLEEVVRRAPVKGIVLERDEDLPPFEEILGELERARAIGRRHGRWA